MAEEKRCWQLKRGKSASRIRLREARLKAFITMASIQRGGHTFDGYNKPIASPRPFQRQTGSNKETKDVKFGLPKQ